MAKIVVIGGTGLIGSKVVAKLREHGHDALAASPNTGVNAITGEGLAEALAGAHTVVDVSNSPSFAPDDVMEFFTTSTRNLLDAEATAGVAHHAALTIVGTDRPQSIPYFAAKIAQEKLIRESGIAYTLVHATQFFEFVGGIADVSTDGDEVRLPGALVQPIAAEDVATAVARAAASEPAGDFEIAGPPERRPRRQRSLLRSPDRGTHLGPPRRCADLRDASQRVAAAQPSPRVGAEEGRSSRLSGSSRAGGVRPRRGGARRTSEARARSARRRIPRS
jgi:uncharacterized protein YbjT (DUF2867 family)